MGHQRNSSRIFGKLFLGPFVCVLELVWLGLSALDLKSLPAHIQGHLSSVRNLMFTMVKSFFKKVIGNVLNVHVHRGGP